jgi:hypothetical protein
MNELEVCAFMCLIGFAVGMAIGNYFRGVLEIRRRALFKKNFERKDHK